MNTKENVKNAFGVDDRKKEESKPMAQIIIPSTEFPSNVRARVESMSDPEVRKRRKAWMDETDPELKERKEQEMWDCLNILGKKLEAEDKEQNTMRKIFTSESVTEGHPDKIADQISDAVLDAILAEDPNGRVACETVVTTDLIHIVGEISTTSSVNIPQIARDTVLGIGYDRAEYGFDGSTCKVLVNIDEQSPDIARGIDVPWKITDKICSRTDKV